MIKFKVNFLEYSLKSLKYGAGLFGFCFISFIFFLSSKSHETFALKGENYYNQGVSGKTLFEREDYFNKALDQFLQLEEKSFVTINLGKLYFDIGNTYFQLQEFPLAYLYYLKAKNLIYDKEALQENIDHVLKQLKIEAPLKETLFDELVSFNWPLRLMLFSAITFILFLSLSLFIWTKYRWALIVSIILSICFFAVGLNLSFYRYFYPIKALLIQAAEIRQGAGLDYGRVGELPIAACTLVEILEVSEEGNFVKIVTQNKTVGYVPQKNIRLISDD